MMILAQAKTMSCKKGSKYILKDINWTINSAEHWIVMGNNGCGKTTLASIMAGYQPYSVGEVLLYGETLNAASAERLRSQVCFVSTSYFDKCLFHENGLNIVLGGRIGQLCEDERITDADVIRAKHLLQALGIGQKGLYPYDLLSCGQRQKIMLARGLMMRPKRMILDEPCNGLDMLSRDQYLNTLKEISACVNTSIVCVTHYSDEIMPFFTHILLLKNGAVFAQGKINEIITADTMSAFFEKKTNVWHENDRFRFQVSDELIIEKKFWWIE